MSLKRDFCWVFDGAANGYELATGVLEFKVEDPIGE